MTRESSALVIGGGIAGIQAALDLADAGVRVYLIEKGDSIGGRMAQTDKTFPTLDCSSCTLTPRTAEAGSHPGIELLTRTELDAIERVGAAFHVRLRCRPRYVDPEACVSCGRCTEECRLKGHVPSAFDLGLRKTSAIGVPFPQAVPSSYAINPEACLYLTRGKCGKEPKCVSACQVGAIRLDEEESRRELTVDAVVLATGYDLYRPEDAGVGRPELGYGRYPEVITNLQFERLSSASGPTGGKLKVGATEPKRIAFVQCVGSRDRTTGASYCSRVCCMVSVKQAVLALEKIPGVEVTLLYMDLRAFGKGYEEFLERAQRMGLVLRRGNVSEIYRSGSALALRFEDTLLGRAEELAADLVVLGAGLRPRAEYAAVAELLGVPLGPDGFFLPADPRDPAVSPAPGVFLAGVALGPMDIPDAVASGSAAAGAAVAHVRRAACSVSRSALGTESQGTCNALAGQP